MEKELLIRLNHLEKRYRTLKWISFGLLIPFTLLFFAFGFTQKNTKEIIRAKGIVIEDENGRDRILIGAPIPYSKDRVRTDTALVRKYWSKLLGVNPEKYMDYYKDYYHGTEGIVIMNEEGFDRVLLGDKLADSNTGKRMFEAAGITWNDKIGFELGGAGVNTNEDGSARSVIGLDNPNGEAVHLAAFEDGSNALIIGGNNGRIIVTLSDKNGFFSEDSIAFSGIKYFNESGKLIWEQKMNN